MSLADLPAPAIVAKVHSNRMPGAVGMMQTVELTQGIPEERVRAAHLSCVRGVQRPFHRQIPIGVVRHAEVRPSGEPVAGATESFCVAS